MATTALFCIFLAAISIQGGGVTGLRFNLWPKLGYPANLANPHVIGGIDAKPAQIPYQARIEMIDSEGWLHLCGGSLISDTWVLTAAHCLDGYDNVTVRLGVLDSTINEPGSQVLTSYSTIMHELYDKKTLQHDIGLIKLPQPVPISSKNPRIKTIHMAPLSFKNKNYTGVRARVSGWGQISDSEEEYSTTLQYLNVTVIDRKQCLETFPDIHETNLCALGHELTGACYGDSGGPLVIRHNEMDVLIGIQSFVSSMRCEGKPAGFTNVASYRHWIAQKTGFWYFEKHN